MADATCKTCPHWKPGTSAEDREIDWGECHIRSCDEWPEMPGDDFCSEHPLRQHVRLAALAMQGMLADETGGEGNVYELKSFTKRAFDIADAMIAELAKRLNHG